jgi:DNA-binding response OmpR family regulator
MNENRLDQILIRLGYINEEQIRNALRKQRIHGGRIGTHLLNNKDVDEGKLAEALSLQHRVPAFDPDRDPISLEFVKTLPGELVSGNEVLPIDYDAGSGVLTMVVTDPKNEKALTAVKRGIKCTKIRILVTPEAVFANLVANLGIETEIDGMHKRVKLPDLFEQTEGHPAKDETQFLQPAEEKNLPKVLLISNEVFLKNFLGPIFEREGFDLLAPPDGNEIREHLNSGQVRKTLVAGDLAPQVRHWCRHRAPFLPGLDIIEFSRISTSLLDNLASYDRMYRSLTQSLRILTEAHAAQAGFTPPYDLLREDIGNLAKTLEMNRLAIDALQLAALLIVPTKTSVAAKNFLSSPEDDFAGINWHRTLEQAKFLEFPWPIDDAILAFREILSERVNLKECSDCDPEMALAGQILAIVWYHFYGVARGPCRSDGYVLTLKSELRKKSGLLARSEVVEAYLRLIERSAENLRATAYFQLFIVGKSDHNLIQFATRLRYLGYHPVQIGSLEEAAKMSERQPPAAIFVHEPSFPKEILVCASLFKKREDISLYAITMKNDPSQMLNLFDAGFDDVFPFPYNMDIVAARLRKTTTERPKPGRPGSFQAAFSAFSFTDLLQGLSQGLKSVKIDLVRSNGNKATIYLNRGRLEHASCGELRGPEAIYEVITWLDDGEFIVEPAKEFPEQNIEMSLESVLMEGCRILDESRA